MQSTIDLFPWEWVQEKKSWTPLPAKTLSESSDKIALTVSKTTLEPKITLRTTPVVPKTFPNSGHSISPISETTPFHKLSPPSLSFLSCIAFFNSEAKSDWLGSGSGSGSGSEVGWFFSSTTHAVMGSIRRRLRVRERSEGLKLKIWDCEREGGDNDDDDDDGKCKGNVSVNVFDCSIIIIINCFWIT